MVKVGSPTPQVPHAEAPAAIENGASSAAITQQTFTTRTLGMDGAGLYVANRRSTQRDVGNFESFR